MKKTFLFPVFIVTLLYLIGAVTILPQFDFPFNDDWSFIRVTKTLFETGHLVFTSYEANFFIFQVLLGFIALYITGHFSFFSLHLVTYILSFLGSIAFFAYLKQLRLDSWHAFVGTLFLVFNTIFFLNSFTFMTDVPALSLCLIALYFFQRAINSGKNFDLILATLFSLFGFFIRQFNILLIAAFYVYYIVAINKKRFNPITIVIVFVLPVIIAIIAYQWFIAGNIIYVANVRIRYLKELEQFYQAMLSVGFFIFPLSLPLILGKWENPQEQKKAIVFVVILFVGLLFVDLLDGQKFPFLGNNISIFGVFGNETLLRGKRIPIFSNQLRIIFTFFSLIGTSFLLSCLAHNVLSFFQKNKALLFHKFFSNLHKLKWSHQSFLYLFSVFYLFALIPMNYIFDRYLIYLLPGSIVLLLTRGRTIELNRIVLIISLVFQFIFSTTLVLDTVAWFKVKWEEGRKLIGEGVDPLLIDGGYEWAGYYYDYINRKPRVQFHGFDRSSPKSWYLQDRWPEFDDQYILSFSPLAGYEIIGKRAFRGTFLLPERYIYVLKRLPPTPH